MDQLGEKGEHTYSIVIPVHNAIEFAERQINGIKSQTREPRDVFIIDSESVDRSCDHYRAAGFTVVPIDSKRFDHGGTRNIGWKMCQTDLVLFLTHDAIPRHSECFELLCAPFTDPDVGVVSGRQLARDQAGAIERHARLFNYPTSSNTRVWPQAGAGGFRAIFNSNSFAAYRRSALENFGGFPEGLIFGEDQVAAGRALLNGWLVAYASEAMVEHSHGYTLFAEFRRYFDIGVSHEQNRLLFKNFPDLSREGRRFVKSEVRYLLRHAPQRVPEAALRSAMKLLGYRLGKQESRLPLPIKRRLAMNATFFSKGGASYVG